MMKEERGALGPPIRAKEGRASVSYEGFFLGYTAFYDLERKGGDERLQLPYYMNQQLGCIFWDGVVQDHF